MQMSYEIVLPWNSVEATLFHGNTISYDTGVPWIKITDTKYHNDGELIVQTGTDVNDEHKGLLVTFLIFLDKHSHTEPLVMVTVFIFFSTIWHPMISSTVGLVTPLSDHYENCTETNYGSQRTWRIT